MTIKDLEKLLHEIKLKAEQGDYEAAHSREDDMREEVLKAIAEEDQSPNESIELAKLALSTSKYDFPRWCA